MLAIMLPMNTLSIRKMVNRFLSESESGLAQSMSMAMVILIILNVLAVILETVPSLSESYGRYFYWFEVFSVAIFTFEYVIRLWAITAKEKYKKMFAGRLRYAATPMMIIDLLAFLPFYLPFFLPLDPRILRILRLFRIFRIFKATRYSKHMKIMGHVILEKKEELSISFLVAMVILVFASSIMYVVENAAQPEAFASIPHAMWWGVSTLTTVGYGDVYPITPLGRMMASIMALLGIGLVALPAGILASGFSDYSASKNAHKEAIENDRF